MSIYKMTISLMSGFLLAIFSITGASANKATIAVTQIVEHPSLDATRKGLLDGLEKAGYIQGKNLNFKYQTAQGKIEIAQQIAKQFIGEKPDVLVGIATPTAQALVANTKEIPIVFTAVTDPVAAKLIKSLEKPGGNVTGLSDMSPIAQQMKLVRSLMPKAKSIGLIYNPGEANSVVLVDQVKKFGAENGFEIIEGTIVNSSEVKATSQVVAGKADMFFLITDNTSTSAMESLIAVANEAGKPVMSSFTSAVEKGAVIAVGFDYYQLGMQTADYIVQVLKGKKPANIPARVGVASNVFINQKAAAKYGIEIPEDLLKKAKKIYK